MKKEYEAPMLEKVFFKTEEFAVTNILSGVDAGTGDSGEWGDFV